MKCYDWLRNEFFQRSIKFKACKFRILFVASIPTKFFYPSKSFYNYWWKKRIFVQFSKNLLRDQDNFSKWKILYKWDILRRKQSTASRSTIWYILQRMGWVTRGRFSNLWAAACKVQKKVAIEHIWSRSTSSQLVDEKVSFEILCMKVFLLTTNMAYFFAKH